MGRLSKRAVSLLFIDELSLSKSASLAAHFFQGNPPQHYTTPSLGAGRPPVSCPNVAEEG